MTTVDPYEELASMFLTGPDRAAPAGRESEPSAIEFLLVGHLPVRAGLWLVPFADRMAHQVGPVGLTRLDGNEPTLQLICGEAVCPHIDGGPTLRASLESIAPYASRWLVRPHEQARPEDLIRAAPDRITLLSSGDDAAIVAAYRMFKELVEAASEADRELPALGVAVLGAPESRAQIFVERLNRTTSAFLDTRIPLRLCMPRMDAVRRISCNLTFPRETSPSLDQLVSWIDHADTHHAHTSPGPVGSIRPNDEPQSQTDQQRTPHAATAPEPAAPAPEMRQQPPAEDPRPIEHEVAAGAASHESPTVETCRVKLHPKGFAIFESKPSQTPREPARAGQPVPLADHVEGLTALPVRCPGHEHVELAVDAAGGVHLLGREDALRELPVVEKWAIAHREILAMACRDQSFDLTASITSHLFTAEPVTLSDLHASGMKLHVLTPITVGASTVWYAAPLNR